MKILLISEETETLHKLEIALKDLPSVGFARVERSLYLEPPLGLDAIFLTLPAAERWNPDFKSPKAQVLRTRQNERDRGFPHFVVTGINLAQNDPQDALSQARVVLKEALSAVHEHNHKNDEKITTLGFWVMTLTNDVSASELSGLLHEVDLNANQV